MSKFPWGTMTFLGLCACGFVGREIWESHQQHSRYSSEATTIETRLSSLFERGYTAPAEEILKEYDSVRELDSFRDQLASIEGERARARSLDFEVQLQRQLYEETGGFIIEMALNKLAEGDYEGARQSIAIFDRIPDLDPVRKKISAVEAEIKGTNPTNRAVH